VQGLPFFETIFRPFSKVKSEFRRGLFLAMIVNSPDLKSWQQIMLLSKPSEVLPIIVIFLGLAAIVMIVRPKERGEVRTAGALFGFSLVLLLTTNLCYWFALPSAGRFFHGTALLAGGVAVVNLLAALLFGVGVDFFRPQTPRILRDLCVAVGYIGVVFWLLSRAGVTLSSIVTTSAVITAVIAFALQDTLGNILGGLALQLEGTIRVGDWIRIDKTEGKVKELRWRHTTVETRNWDSVVIPNSVLMKGEVTLLGKRTGQPVQHRQWVYFNVDFRVSPPDVISAVDDALQSIEIECVASEPKPHCIAFEFKESYIQYAVRYWLTDLAQDEPTNSRVRHRILFALKRAGIEPSIPAQAVFVTEETAEHKDLHQEKEINLRVKALQDVELFHTLDQDELRMLAERLRFAPFVHGEAMTRQGAIAHSLYVITRGSGEVVITEDGLRRTVATLRCGDFFGEIALLTGERRTATVIALENTDCYRLDSEGVNELLHSRPEIAEHISLVLARRKVELNAVRENLDADARAKMMANAQKDFFARISKYFGLRGEPPKTSKPNFISGPLGL
jgi:small-conductance mechanosensitive channel/CRP-like cAMP-binding protein